MLQWNKVGSDSNYSYILSYNNQSKNISGLTDDPAVKYTVEDLTAGTEYNFILYTSFGGAQSSGYSFTTVTSKSDFNSVK